MKCVKNNKNEAMKAYKWSLYVLVLLIVTLISHSCKLEEDDPCKKSEYPEGKVINLETTLNILEFSSFDPVVYEHFRLEISKIDCAGDTTQLYYIDTDSTGTSGTWVSDNLNFVLYNTEDKVEFTAIAPNLDFHGQNFQKITKKFGQFKGTGKDEVSLTIYKRFIL